MDNPWVVSILSGLIVAVLGYYVKQLLYLRKDSYKATMFSITVASVVFVFGAILQPAVQLLIEGSSIMLELYSSFRHTEPLIFFLLLLVTGLLPGIITGLAVLKAQTLQMRIYYGAISAPLALTLFDSISFLYEANYVSSEYQVFGWNDIYFTFLSNFFGGIFAGIIIGTVVHLYLENSSTSASSS
jgi:hypothetical protein